MREEALQFGADGSLVGIYTAPRAADGRAATSVVLLNAGVLHRVGPNRLYVQLARRLATLGFAVLRFDHSGIGDSAPRADDLPFRESSVCEVGEALDWLERERGMKRFVLAGLCSGTLTAFHAAAREPRVVGLILLTALLEDPSSVPESAVQEAVNRRVARSYVTEKLFRGRSWRNLLTGKTDPRRILRVLGRGLRERVVPRRQRAKGVDDVTSQIERLVSRGVSVLFVFSEPTVVREYFRMTLEPEIPRLRRQGAVRVEVIPQSDHTFTSLDRRERLFRLVEGWIGSAV